MGLKVVKPASRIVSKVIFAIITIIVAAFVLRVFIWENNYYNEKEGSERAAPEFSGDISVEATSDEEITKDQIKEHIVAADKPRYMTIEKLGIKNARVFEMGVTSNGQMQSPYSIYDAGWYKNSSLPGKGGTSLFDGHSGAPGTKGIFKDLKSLSSGDMITIEMGDGTVYKYRVFENYTVSLKEANDKLRILFTTPVEGVESLSIITCTGDYSLTQKTFTSRQFLRATKVD